MNKAKTYKVRSGDFLFSFSDEELHAFDIIKNATDDYNVIQNHRSVNARLISADAAGKKSTVEINGERFDIEIKDELDQMLDSMGFGKAAAKQVKEIKAPMPGLVLEISVHEGQEIKAGERVLILEAMKMENSIMMQADSTIKRICIKPGQAVEKGQVLVELA